MQKNKSIPKEKRSAAKSRKLSAASCKLQAEKKGFTLIEMLLVIAIIGILAGTIMVAIGNQRTKARKAQVLEGIRSVMPYAVDCFMRGGTVSTPTVTDSDVTGGNNVCNTSSSSVVWPNLGSIIGNETDKPCSAVAVSNVTNVWTITVTCTGGNITCYFGAGGNCVLN